MNVSKENRDLAIRIAEHYGLENQISIAQEECAELVQALSKLRRYTPGPDSPLDVKLKYSEARVSVAEEMADVINMITQLLHLMHNEHMVEFWLHHKLGRKIRDIEKETA